MTKIWYRNFRVSELDWGINVRDFASEIEDKQWVSVINWNFKWNKLVSSKWLKEKYVNTNVGWINWILKDWDDIYYTAGWKLFKNWVEVPINTWTLPNKKCYISIWWDLIFFTFDDWTETPKWLEWDVLTDVTGVWTPRYNIIYNGKWVLWWFDNDNIFFSKTATPTAKEDIYDFAAYSAWSQSVWWDSRWFVKWFKVGENWLYVFKEDWAYYSNTEKDTWTSFNFIFNKITSNWTVGQSAIAEVEQEVFYYDWINKAVRRIWYEQNLTTLRDVAVSREIETIFDVIAEDQSEATMSFKYPNLKLFLKSRLVWEWVNDICLVYNVENKSWAQETNKDCFVSDKGFLWSAYRTTIFEDDFWAALLSSEMEWEFISKSYVFWDPIDFKKYWELEVAWRMDSTVTLTVGIYVDAELIDERIITKEWVKTSTLWSRVLGNSVLWWDMSPTELTPFTEKIELFDSWQNFQIVLSYKGIGSVEISNVNIQWKSDRAFSIYA